MATKRQTRRAPARPAPDTPGLSTALYTSTGRQVTVADFIVEQIAAGSPPEHAALSAGLLRAEFNALIRDGSTQLARYQSGADWHKDFTPDQQDSALFVQRVQRAAGEYASRAVLVLESLARGGVERRTTVVKRARDANGSFVEQERTERVETTLPDADVIKWRLERMFPSVYGGRQRLDLTIADMTDGEDVRAVIAERLSQIAERYAGAIEADVTIIDDPDPTEEP